MNDESAFLDLLNRHGGVLQRVAGLYADSPADRQDLLQEMTFHLWKAFPAFRGESRASTWMYRIALNTALAGYRRRRVKLFFPTRLPDPDPPRPDNPAVAQLRAGIRRLPRGERALVALYMEDLSHEEIGGILGLTANHVGVKLHRIKKELRNLFNT